MDNQAHIFKSIILLLFTINSFGKMRRNSPLGNKKNVGNLYTLFCGVVKMIKVETKIDQSTCFSVNRHTHT